MIKNILFDFDGVILDSMKIKGDGFVELFSNAQNIHIQRLEKYHYENGGISRFEKIKYFYQNILNKEISNDEIISLSNKFSDIIKNKLFDKNNLIKETIEFIENNHKKYNLHIVSGAEHEELNNLCKYFDITNYFLTIKGSPIKKDILVKDILNQYDYKTNETILIGDSINDYYASKDNKLNFYGFNNLNLQKISEQYIYNFGNIPL